MIMKPIKGEDYFNDIEPVITFDRGYKMEYYIPTMFRYIANNGKIVYHVCYAKVHNRQQAIDPHKELFSTESGFMNKAIDDFLEMYADLEGKHIIVANQWMGEEPEYEFRKDMFSRTLGQCIEE